MTKNRLEAFSDGVIAIIITIMVLEFKVPHEATWDSILKIWPVMLSYVVSFVNVGIYWANHHHLLHTIKEVRGGILWSNLHLLFWLSLIPFATAWMGENHFAQNPVILYSVIASFCGVAYYILLMNIKSCNPNNPALLTVLKGQSKKGSLSIILYLIAIGFAFFNTTISGIFIITVAILWLVPDRNIERATELH